MEWGAPIESSFERKFARELGILARSIAPLENVMGGWAKVSDDDKEKLYQKAMQRFDIVDFHMPHVKYYVDEVMSWCYRAWRSKLYNAFNLAKKEGKDPKTAKPPGVAKDTDWQWLSSWFESPELQAKSEVNTKNHSKMLYNHIAGFRSFMETRHALKNKDFGELPIWIEFHKLTHFNSKCGKWVAPKAEQHFDEMVEAKNTIIDAGIGYTEDKICDAILGTKSGNVKGLGCGPKPKSKRSQSYLSAAVALKAEVETYKSLASIEELQLETCHAKIAELEEGRQTDQARLAALEENFKRFTDGSTPSSSCGMTEQKKVQRRKVLAKWLKENILRLGPTFTKIGQQFSTRIKFHFFHPKLPCLLLKKSLELPWMIYLKSLILSQ